MMGICSHIVLAHGQAKDSDQKQECDNCSQSQPSTEQQKADDVFVACIILALALLLRFDPPGAHVCWTSAHLVGGSCFATSLRHLFFRVCIPKIIVTYTTKQSACASAHLVDLSNDL